MHIHAIVDLQLGWKRADIQRARMCVQVTAKPDVVILDDFGSRKLTHTPQRGPSDRNRLAT